MTKPKKEPARALFCVCTGAASGVAGENAMPDRHG